MRRRWASGVVIAACAVLGAALIAREVLGRREIPGFEIAIVVRGDDVEAACARAEEAVPADRRTWSEVRPESCVVHVPARYDEGPELVVALRTALDAQRWDDPPVLQRVATMDRSTWLVAQGRPVIEGTELLEALRRRIEVLSGVGAVSVCGADRVTEIVVDPDRLDAHGIATTDLALAVALDLPAGRIEGAVGWVGGRDALDREVRGGVRLSEVSARREGISWRACRAARGGEAIAAMRVVPQVGADGPRDELREFAAEAGLEVLEGTTTVELAGTDDLEGLSRLGDGLAHRGDDGVIRVQAADPGVVVHALDRVPGVRVVAVGRPIARVWAPRDPTVVADVVARLHDAGLLSAVLDRGPSGERAIRVDRERAAAHEVDPREVARALEAIDGWRGEGARVRVEVGDRALERLSVRARHGEIVRLIEVAQMEADDTPALQHRRRGSARTAIVVTSLHDASSNEVDRALEGLAVEIEAM